MMGLTLDPSKAFSGQELAYWGITYEEANALVVREDSPKQIYDLAERTAAFGEKIVLFAKKIPWSPVNNRLIDQLVGAGTSIGANYCEADDGVSRADFKHRIGTCRKETRETKFFLRMVATSESNLKGEARELLGRRPRSPSDFQPHLAEYEHVMAALETFVIRHSSFSL